MGTRGRQLPVGPESQLRAAWSALGTFTGTGSAGSGSTGTVAMPDGESMPGGMMTGTVMPGGTGAPVTGRAGFGSTGLNERRERVDIQS